MPTGGGDGPGAGLGDAAAATDPPSSRRLLARAAFGAAADALPWRERPATLPTQGRTQVDVRVGADLAARYATVVGARVGGAVPPLLVHVLGFDLSLDLLTAADMPFPLLGLVHVAQRATVHADVHVGDRLDLAVHVTDLRPHPSGRQLDVVLTAHRAGSLVWEGVSTYLRRGPDGSRDAPRALAGLGAPAPGPDDLRLDVPADTGRRYARVAGDANPIHLHPVSARALGFPRAIAHGMWTLARVVATLEGRLPGPPTVAARFEKPVLLPARTTLASARGADGAWRLALHDRDRPDVRHCTVEVTPG